MFLPTVMRFGVERGVSMSGALALLLFLSLGVGIISAQSPFAVEERRLKLEKELAALEEQITEQRELLEGKKQERVSLERDVSILNAKIQVARLSIRARTIAIEKLSREIKDKERVISAHTAVIDKEKESLAELIRKTNELDSYSFIEIILSSEEISDFFVDLDSFDVIKRKIDESYRAIEAARDRTESEKDTLESKREDEMTLKTLQELEKRKIEREEAEKKRIVELSKGLESEYQKILRNKEKSAAVIRTELFTLRGSAAITFAKALELATIASEKTTVRPALILGIIAEESNLGENIGTGSWRVDMKNPRDTEPFLAITTRLGLDPDRMPVSKRAWYGFGGAMGPAQFLPSTWILFEERIAEASGHQPPNPWDPYDAFIAAAILLKDNGAAAGTFEAERLASLRYFAGRRNALRREYAFYGDEVMELAEKYQRQINILNASAARGS